MSKLRIGPKLTLPVDTVTGTLIVYGGKGMGKSVFASVLSEELSAAGQRFSVIDPMGVFWGLRHSADGKGPGIEILILGGKHGDLPIEPTGGAVVADLVADESVNVVIDISRKADGKMWSRGERIRFVADYCERLYERQGERRRPIMQIIDECGRFCPEQIRKDQPEIARCMGAIAELTEEARNVGVGVTLITQRSARMSKSVSELADAMIAFRTVGPRSVDAITDWLGEHVPKERHKEITQALRTLPRGSALVVSPGWLEYEGIAEIRMRHTFDSSATPKAGKEQQASGRGAMPDLERYQQRMSETIERVKADDPKELKRKISEQGKRIAELEKQGAKPQLSAIAAAPAADPEHLKKEFERGARSVKGELGKQLRTYIKACNARISMVGDTLTEAQGRLTNGIEAMAAAEIPVAPVLDEIIADAGKLAPPPAPLARTSVAQRVPLPPRAPRAEQNGNVSEGLTPVAQRIIDHIAELNALGIEKPDRLQVAVLSGYSNVKSSGYEKAIGALRTRGLIDYPDSSSVILTSEGLTFANQPGSPLSSQDLQGRLMRLVQPKASEILTVLIEKYPDAINRQELAEAVGYTNLKSSGFEKAIGRLRTMGLLDYPSTSTAVASSLLFLD